MASNSLRHNDRHRLPRGSTLAAIALTAAWLLATGSPALANGVPLNKGDVLVSVAGTPAAQESLIANSIPQTATIHRGEPSPIQGCLARSPRRSASGVGTPREVVRVGSRAPATTSNREG